ncbi:DUF5677 domain-containing protein [Burkholderia savannae]|nr:DUF5677 domain-containing protein [Burkholderia savannae]
MPNIPRMVQTAHVIQERADTVLLRARVHDSGESRVAATLCLTVAEQFAAAVSLVESGFSSHAPTIVRSMLEGLADLLNVTRDPQYVDQIRYDNARSDVILFTKYGADPSMQDDDEALEALARWNADAEPVRDELKARGFQKLGVEEKFKKAGGAAPVAFTQRFYLNQIAA